jgi:hypothetical protein
MEHDVVRRVVQGETACAVVPVDLERSLDPRGAAVRRRAATGRNEYDRDEETPPTDRQAS